ncbi:MAG TPA: hypothetical protein PLX74_09295 [Chitinophagaceae bacterium]|nr:hypothetical protein [Chitinophagaceae bacterium]
MDKASYYELKSQLNLFQKDDLELWTKTQDKFLDGDLNWTLEEFIKEYGVFSEGCGPFLDQDYDSITGELKETKCYHSHSTYERYLTQLERVFERHWAEYVFSEDIFIAKLTKFKYVQDDGLDNYLHPFYISKGWEYLSKSSIVPWSISIIRQFSDSWHWYYLLHNPSFLWTFEMIDEFKFKIDNFTWINDFDEVIEIEAWPTKRTY